jgi:hypothetical protein
VEDPVTGGQSDRLLLATDRPCGQSSAHSHFQERDMGKYLIAWILGVPAGVLLLVYLFAH